MLINTCTIYNNFVCKTMQIVHAHTQVFTINIFIKTLFLLFAKA